MRTITILVSLLASVAAAAEIPQGAHVLLRMENSVNTRTAKEGDFVYLRTAVADRQRRRNRRSRRKLRARGGFGIEAEWAGERPGATRDSPGNADAGER